MRKISKLLCVLYILALVPAIQAKDLGVGLVVGQPTGLCGRFLLGGDRSFEMALGWSSKDIGITGAYLVELKKPLFVHHDQQLRFIYGVGPRLETRVDRNHPVQNKSYLGVRFPVGLTYNFGSIPVDLFTEIGPTMDLLPTSYFGIDFQIGARFYF